MFDQAATLWINDLAGQNATLDALMVAVTTFGVPAMILLVAVQWWMGGRNRKHLRHAIVAAGLSTILGFAANQLILLLVHRVRPYDAGLTHLIVPPSGEWSFPSDHATVAAAIATAFALHGERLRAIVFGLFALLVAYSRVYVGTHYLGDVAGGIATAVIAALVVGALYREGTGFDRRVTGLL
jgi:undecaprenyl-diphosphatase